MPDWIDERYKHTPEDQLLSAIFGDLLWPGPAITCSECPATEIIMVNGRPYCSEHAARLYGLGSESIKEDK